MPLQHRRSLNSALVFYILRFQHALVIAQQPRRREDRLVAEAGCLEEVIVSAGSASFAVAVSRNIVVVFGDAVLVGVVEPVIA